MKVLFWLLFTVFQLSFSFAALLRKTQISKPYVVSLTSPRINTVKYRNPQFVAEEAIQINWDWNNYNPDHPLRVYFVKKNGIGQVPVMVERNQVYTHDDGEGEREEGEPIVGDQEVFQIYRNGNEEHGLINFEIPYHWESGFYYLKFVEYQIKANGKGKRVGLTRFRKVSFRIDNTNIQNRKARLAMISGEKYMEIQENLHKMWDTSKYWAMKSVNMAADSAKYVAKKVVSVSKFTARTLGEISGISSLARRLDGTPRNLDDAVDHRNKKQFVPRIR